MFKKLKNLFESKKIIRGVRFYFLVNKIFKKDEQEKLESNLKNSNILTNFYSDIKISFSSNYVKKNWTYIKVYCSNSNYIIKESESQSFYETLFDNYSEYVRNFFNKHNLKTEIFDFRILFRIYPEEDTSEYIQLCNLDKISQKIVQKISTEKIPKDTKDMINYLKGLKIFEKKILDITLKMAEEQNLQVYGSFGVRNEYSTELDVITPPPTQEELEIGEMINVAIQLKNQGRFEEALSIYDSILQKEPDNEMALINKAVLLKNTDKIGEAIKIYDKILKKDPHNFGALANKGAALACIFKYKEAIEFYDKALKIQPDEQMV